MSALGLARGSGGADGPVAGGAGRPDARRVRLDGCFAAGGPVGVAGYVVDGAVDVGAAGEQMA